MQKNPSGARSLSVIVIGAGPAGMMAAIGAAQKGARVALCEQLDRPGVKLLATGGGRCNLTNALPDDTFMERFGRQGRFMQPALARMNSARLREFLARHGVATHCPDGLRVYPVSDSATTVQQALQHLTARLGVSWLPGSRVTELLVDSGQIRGVRTASATLTADRVIVATGGRTYPELGATGSGYELARRAGHTIADPLPVLTPLFTRESWPRECAGVSVSNSRAWIDEPGAPESGCTGDLLFTHKGISGPAVLDLSRDVVPLLQSRREVRVRIELTPGTGEAQWLEQLEQWQRSEGSRRVVSLLDQKLPVSLAETVAQVAGIRRETVAAELTRAQRQALAGVLAGAPLTVTGAGGWDEAMVTRGGVSLKEVDPRTLESRLVRGLFFAGEVLDLDGPSGGFNLQWAFSSGWLAGHSALT